MVKSSSEHKAAIVAQLLGKGQSQAEICESLARQLGLGQNEAFTSGYVSKLVKQAVEKGWVERVFQVHRDKIPEEFQINDSYDYLANELLTRYPACLRRVHISNFSLESIRSETFRDDAAYLLALFKEASYIGISSGYTIDAFLTHLKNYHVPKNLKTEAQIFPLSAEIYSYFESDLNTNIGVYNASLLAKRLTRPDF